MGRVRIFKNHELSRSCESPESILKICPVMEEAAGEWRKFRVAATSSTDGIFLRGCLSSIMGIIFSPPTMETPIAVGVNVGATTLTRTLGARSAAKAIANPSSPDFAAEIAQWLGRPVRAATDERKAIDPSSLGRID